MQTLAADNLRIPVLTGSETNYAAQARQLYRQTGQRVQTETNSLEAAWQFARACFDVAEFSTNDTERATFAEQGIAVSKQLVKRAPTLAQAHYYLGMNYGQLARTKSVGALKLVDKMETEFSIALEIDDKFDYAGPDRNLGLLYLEAPSLVSIGNRNKARTHLQQAVELAPDYPENRLNLVEAYLKWNDHHSATREFRKLEEIWPEAKKKFNGDHWAWTWMDWTQRFQAAQKKIEAATK